MIILRKELEKISMEMNVEESTLLRFYLVTSSYSSNSCMEKAMDDILHKNNQSVAVRAVKIKNRIVKYLDTALAKEDADEEYKEGNIQTENVPINLVEVITDTAEKITNFVVEALDGDETEKLGRLLTLELDKCQGNLTYEEYKERRKRI